jgi:hypothetical protein
LIIFIFIDDFNKAWHKKIKEKYSSTDTDEGNIKTSSNGTQFLSNKRPLIISSDDTDNNF